MLFTAGFYHCRFLWVLLLCFTQVVTADTPDITAAEIMQRADARDTGKHQVTSSTLTLIDRNDRQRERRLKMYRLDQQGVEKTVMFFLSPADVKDTAYLNYDWDDKNKDNDSWLYLPALKKTKRVAAADESGSFMGSDFNYSDINGVDVDDYHYSIANENDVVSGHDCWVVLSTPKTESIVKKTGYLSSKSWVRKDNYMVVQAIIDVKKGKRKKYFSSSNIEKIDGIWTAKVLQMITTRNNKKEHSSVFSFDEIDYKTNVDERLFDSQAMMRGWN